MLVFALVVTAIVGLLVVLVAAGLVVQKITYRARMVQSAGLEALYTQKIGPILLEDLKPGKGTSDSILTQQIMEEACRPLCDELASLWYVPRRAHRAALKKVLLGMSRELVGETRARLTHVFDIVGFVQEEVQELHSRKWWRRAKACQHLALMQATDATAQLVTLLNDTEEDVRTEAALALVAITGVNALRLLLTNLQSMSVWMFIQLSRVVLPMASVAVPDLIAGLKSGRPSIQRFCVDMLGEIGDIAACDPLVEFISTAEPGVRSRAYLVLGRLGDEKGKRVLLDGLQDEEEQSRVAAAQGLGYLASPETAPFLKDHLLHDTIAVRLASGKSLTMIEGKGREMLLHAYRKSDSIGKRVILQFLEELGISEKKLEEME